MSKKIILTLLLSPISQATGYDHSDPTIYNPDEVVLASYEEGCPVGYHSLLTAGMTEDSIRPILNKYNIEGGSNSYLVDNGLFVIDGTLPFSRGNLYSHTTSTESGHYQWLCGDDNVATRIGLLDSIVENVIEYKTEVVDETVIEGNHILLAPVGSAANQGVLNLQSELGKVFYEGQYKGETYSIPKPELKVTKDVLKLPNAAIGTVKDGLDSIIALSEMLKLKKSVIERRDTSRALARVQIDEVTQKIDEIISDAERKVNSSRPYNINLFKMYKRELKEIVNPHDRLSLYETISNKAKTYNYDDYLGAAQKIDIEMEEYKKGINYEPHRKLNSYSSAAKPKVTTLKVVKGITSSFSVIGDMVGFFLDIALLDNQKPKQLVYVGTAADNQEAVAKYADSLVLEAGTIEAINQTYQKRSEALAKAIDEIRPHGSTQSQRPNKWTNILWILNEKALLRNLRQGRFIFGRHITPDDSKVPNYFASNKYPTYIQPLSSELHFAKYGVSETSSLLNGLNKTSYDPKTNNQIVKSSLNSLRNSERINIINTPRHESFSGSLNMYLDGVEELSINTKKFIENSQLYKTFFYIALYSISGNSNDFVSMKIDEVINNYEYSSHAQNEDERQGYISMALSSAEEINNIFTIYFDSLSGDRIDAILEIVKERANRELKHTGDERLANSYEYFRFPGESDDAIQEHLVVEFKNAVYKVGDDSNTTISGARVTLNEARSSATRIVKTGSLPLYSS